jgi:hypothetical protein
MYQRSLDESMSEDEPEPVVAVVQQVCVISSGPNAQVRRTSVRERASENKQPDSSSQEQDEPENARVAALVPVMGTGGQDHKTPLFPVDQVLSPNPGASNLRSPDMTPPSKRKAGLSLTQLAESMRDLAVDQKKRRPDPTPKHKWTNWSRLTSPAFISLSTPGNSVAVEQSRDVDTPMAGWYNHPS